MKQEKENVVYKDVVLLPSLSTKAVLTHQTRRQLENDGFVVHRFPVEKSMDEGELRVKIIELFPFLQDIEFNFVKSCYCQIVTPKVAHGVSFSAARMLGIAGQGSIYIQPEQDLSVPETSVISDDESPPSSPVKKIAKSSSPPSSTATGTLPATFTSADVIPGPSCILTQQEIYQQLKEMFPDKDKQELTDALRHHGSMTSATLAQALMNTMQKNAFFKYAFFFFSIF